MNKQIKTLLVTLLLCFVLAPAAKANAAVVTPATPNGLGLYSQKESTIAVDWTFDANLNYYSDVYPGYYGYEIVISNLKGSVMGTYDSSIYSDYFKWETDSKVAFIATNSKFKTQPFKFKVRSYVYDEAQNKVYSAFSSEKVIVPRATITSKKLSNGKVKISWSKVTGAKDYSIYLSSNDGKSFKKIGTTSKKSYTIKKSIKRYKDYYVYVQANKVKCGKKKMNSTKPVDKGSNASGFYISTVYR